MTDRKTVISVIMPSRDPTHVPHLPEGADEVLVVTGPGKASAANAGAQAARGNVLVFVDDDVGFEGNLGYFSYADPNEHWWTVRAWHDGSGDPRTAMSCLGTSLLASIGGFQNWNASIGPFQALRRWAFEAVGGYDTEHPLEDLNLARKLHARGLLLYRVPIVGTVYRPFTPYQETFDRWNRRGMNRYGPHVIRRWIPHRPTQILVEAQVRTV